jgi:hypothetical protein
MSMDIIQFGRLECLNAFRALEKLAEDLLIGIKAL